MSTEPGKKAAKKFELIVPIEVNQERAKGARVVVVEHRVAKAEREVLVKVVPVNPVNLGQAVADE